MKLDLVVSDFREVQTAAGACVRFAVTVTDDGEPLWTQQGFIVDREWVVRPPGTRTKFGKGMMRFTQITPRFEEMLVAAIEKVPDVVGVLGPRKVMATKLPGEVRL